MILRRCDLPTVPRLAKLCLLISMVMASIFILHQKSILRSREIFKAFPHFVSNNATVKEILSSCCKNLTVSRFSVGSHRHAHHYGSIKMDTTLSFYRETSAYSSSTRYSDSHTSSYLSSITTTSTSTTTVTSTTTTFTLSPSSAVSSASASSAVDPEQYRRWLKKQDELRRNISRVCKKYGKEVRVDVGMKQLMYEPKHKLLFCRNAKV